MDSNRVLNIKTETDFKTLCFKVFEYQYNNCEVYQKFCKHFNKHPDNVNSLKSIPFLPIEFFKKFKILSSQQLVQKVFTSSGTTGQQTSKHHITDIELYQKNFCQIFQAQYGSIEDYTILALLPSYLERNGSSLIYMVNHLIEKTRQPDSGFFLDDLNRLKETLLKLETKKQKTILIGVSFALLDFVESYNLKLNHTIVMETGGMKGRRKEITRDELHQKLTKGFGVKHIHSEYGMTELLSQAYSKADGIFELPPTMKVFIRDPEDPLHIFEDFTKTGGINVIDLANINSCAFIATQDLGQNVKKNKLKIIGRFDYSDVRGCNLLTL
ncbi:acyl transferase [Flavobacterium sp. CS20]|uniref:LuxE/PaaK family acyltransferase n=1 Tax=Flavobacterium sp. CS20 TaxID=2775246 RepID=UPI001B3A108B|nr:acyl transferase [Flavobacterium sp. CS20]QTY25987.1 acyl transferase [Flavobacterium sp. CS20]